MTEFPTADWESADGAVRLYRGDCLDLMPRLKSASVDLIIADPPYYRVKGEWWDRQWETVEGFLSWMGDVLSEMRRVLKPNGSLYLFASPQMAARVECKVGESFDIINRITWRKPPFSTKAEMFRKEDLRGFFPASEAIIFAEQRGTDASALAEAGYAVQCGDLHKKVYSGVFGEYFSSEFERAKVTRKEIAALFPSKTGGLTGCVSNWVLGINCPTQEQYETIRGYLNQKGGEYLRREYEDLRRPFFASPDAPYTDVWDFATVGTYPGKHPCEKPTAMMRHIIQTSSRPGAVVLDPFMGSGASLVAAQELGRQGIGIDAEIGNVLAASQRLSQKSLFTETLAL